MIRRSARRSPRTRWPVFFLILFMSVATASGIGVLIRTLGERSFQPKTSIPTSLRQDIQDLILDSCTNCLLSEITIVEDEYRLVAEFKRPSDCPAITIGQRFFTLGVNRSFMADRDGYMITLQPASAVITCAAKWTVQKTVPKTA